eukprot:scaffold286489_cov23-Prasinocladus_malaysianus.AAC.1
MESRGASVLGVLVSLHPKELPNLSDAMEYHQGVDIASQFQYLLRLTVCRLNSGSDGLSY